jgi:hypothetical protein
VLGGPDEGDDPSDHGESEEKIEQEDGQCVALAASQGHDRRQEVHDEPGAEKVEEKHREQMHTHLHGISVAPNETKWKQASGNG